MKFLNLFSPSFTSHLVDPDTISSQSLGSKFCKQPLFSHRLFTYGLYAVMPNLHIIGKVRTGKLWRRVESYHTYVPSSKRTLTNARGSLLVTDYNGHTI